MTYKSKGPAMSRAATATSKIKLEKGSVESTLAKGSVESTHKVPTSHYHTKHCHAVVASIKLANKVSSNVKD
jgi:hypothetical protein